MRGFQSVVCRADVSFFSFFFLLLLEPGGYIMANKNKQSPFNGQEESQQLHAFTALNLNSMTEKYTTNDEYKAICVVKTIMEVVCMKPGFQYG